MASEQYRVSEEVDLGELFSSLWSQKLLIVGVVLAFSFVAALYAFTREPIYQADLSVVAPSHNDIASLNYGRGEGTGLPLVSVSDVYDLFARCLQSESVRQKVFEQLGLAKNPEVKASPSKNDQYRLFSRSFVIAKSGEGISTRYNISVNHQDPQVAVKWGDVMVNLASAMAKDELIKNVMSDAAMRTTMLSKEIAGKREAARKAREDRLSKLKEALAIAQAISLKKPPIITGSAAELSARINEDLAYMRGSDAIQAEIDNLKKRTSDDPFIWDLRQLEERLEFYRDLKVEGGSLRVYQWDGALTVPDRPVKPRKVLIVLGGIVIGAFFGVMLALVRFFARGKKQRFA